MPKDTATIKPERAVLPGRFQPVHKGHVEVIKWALERVDELIIVIGSAQESHTLENPFTAGERMLMIKEALKEIGVDFSKVYIVPIPDIQVNSIWVSYLRSLLPPFSIGISRNPLVVRLFREAGLKVLEPPVYSRDEYSGTRIRELMLKGESWEQYVPRSVANIIKSLDGVSRLREIAKRE